MNSSQDTITKTKTIWTRLPIVIITAIFCCTLWGSASPAIKIGYELFDIAAGDTPSRILFAGTRFIIAGIMVIIFGSLLQKKVLLPKKSSFKYILVLACFQTILQYIFFYMALAHTSGVRGSIINAAGSFFSILLAVYAFKFEKLSARKAAGMIIGFAGVFLCVTGGSSSFLEGGFSVQGEGAMLIAAFASAIAGCFIKLFSQKENPVVLSGYQFFIGGIVMAVVGTLMGGHLTIVSAGSIPLLIYMAFISAGAYTLWGILLKYNPVSTVTVLGFVNPVMGVILSAIFLGEGDEALSVYTLIALVLVSLGIYIINKKKN
ncbi:MAG: DMT family transporter [Butyrivibrio sp.]|uniref:DMT family transporter n=1 Tax=Butyrivibrio sp. TaxID=28121 RepID=UPI0025E9B2FB|nr:DMT family transporter [Butyrivibrio sp.]MCR5771115.1 DMT family transporter [Butyrivibrio sp.]